MDSNTPAKEKKVKVAASENTAPPKEKKEKVQKASKLETAPATDRVVKEIPLSAIHVDHSTNPRGFSEQEIINGFEGDTFFVDSFKSLGQLSPVEGYYLGNDDTQPLTLTEGFRRVTAIRQNLAQGEKIANSGPNDADPLLWVQVLPDPAGGNDIAFRQLVSNSTALTYTLGQQVRLVRGMVKNKCKPKTIAKALGMSPQAANQLIVVCSDEDKDGRNYFADSLEEGNTTVSVAYALIQKRQELLRAEAEAAALKKTGMTPENLEANLEAEDRTAPPASEEQDTPPAPPVLEVSEESAKRAQKAVEELMKSGPTVAAVRTSTLGPDGSLQVKPVSPAPKAPKGSGCTPEFLERLETARGKVEEWKEQNREGLAIAYEVLSIIIDAAASSTGASIETQIKQVWNYDQQNRASQGFPFEAEI